MKSYFCLFSFILVASLHAETHGGVALANAQFAAAVKTVQNSDAVMAELDRVMKIEKIQDSGICSIFQIVTSGQSSQTGQVNPTGFSFMKVTSPAIDGIYSTQVDKQIVVESETLPSCNE